MASNPYNYPPPPPPPPSQIVGPQQPSYQQYGQQPQPQLQQQHQQPYQARGGGHGRGRGNFQQGGRGNFHGSSQYAPPVSYSAPGGYTGPAPVNSTYGQPAPSYGPQQPSSGYPLPQWSQEQQHHQHPPHQQLQHQPAPAPVPLSAQNYHPNYAPQLFNQPAYGQQPQQQPQQQPYQQSPPQPAYAQHSPSPQTPLPGGPPQHWSGPPQHSQPPHNGGGRGRGRGNSSRGSTRGGRGGGRGGMDAPLMGPPIRMGFDNDRPAGPVTQASSGFPPYPNPQHSSPPPYTQAPYQAPPPPQDFRGRGGHSGGQRGGHRAPLDPNPFHSNSRGGRGDRGDRGGRGGFNHQRGKRDPHTGDKARYRSVKDHNPRSDHLSHVIDLHQKPVQVTGPQNTEGKKKKKKKRRTNTLGLTPRTEDHEESDEEDDADEEARLAAVAASGSVPQEPSDLEAWIAERKKKWPTKARREAKELELAKRREMAREQSIRDKAKYAQQLEEKRANEAKLAAAKSAKAQKDLTAETKPAETKLERQQRKAEKLRKQLEKAEKKLLESLQAGSKRKREVGDTGDEEDDGQADGADKNAEDDSDSDNSNDSDSDSESDDSGPEAQSSLRTAPDNVTLPPRAPVQRPCKYFSNGGSCGKKGKCRFLHDQAARDAALKEKAKGGRMTLSERLQQNEKENNELTILKAIKYAAEHGLLDEPSTTVEVVATSEQETKAEGNVDMDWTSEAAVTVESALEAETEAQTQEPCTQQSSEATLDDITTPTLHPSE